MLHGTAVTDGIAIGKVFIKKDTDIEIIQKTVNNIEDELIRFNNAAENCRLSIEAKYDQAMNLLGEEEAEIFNRHLGVFNGSILLGQVRKEIQEQQVNAEYILNEVKKKYANMFDRVADDFLKKKSESIKFIAEQIINELLQVAISEKDDIKGPVIVLANELQSGDLIHVEQGHILGIVVETSSASLKNYLEAGHLNVPVIVDVQGLMEAASNAVEVIIDATDGSVIINPDEELKAEYSNKINHVQAMTDVYEQFIYEATRTEDGHSFELGATVDNMSQIDTAIANGAEGLGLVSTEFLYLGRESAPSSDAQFVTYTEVVAKAKGKPVVFRTMTCHADNSMPFIHMPDVKNPLMGPRGIRISLQEKDMFVQQLMALYKTSPMGPMKVVLPMVGSLEELRMVKEACEEAKMKLQEQDDFYDPSLEIGMMIDTPAVAMMIEGFIPEVDFFIINTTNLLQFSLGIDRHCQAVSALYDIYNPGVIKMVHSVVKVCQEAGANVAITGDMVKEPQMVPLWMAMGVNQIDMDGEMIPKMRWAISRMEKKRWEEILSRVLACVYGQDVRTLVERAYGEDTQ